ncbi:MAG TPA: RidA family protein [Dehalococcoidia bacterium]|nr:RidA family protein [Dehalococcoidia bacterium]
MGAEDRLNELGLALPAVAKPRWAYVPAVQSGKLLFVSGQIGTEDGRVVHPGKLGREVDVAAGQEAARACAISALAVARAHTGSLDDVARVVKLTVFVASADGFTDQPTVANGASELLRDVFGEAGLGARSAVGVAELPLGASVEAEFIFELA